MSFIVSANYRDRKSPYKWLVRQEGQKPQDAVAVKALIATDVQASPATDWEIGFGCSTITTCGDVSYKDEDVEPQEIELKFEGHDFYNPVDKKTHSQFAELTLSADGSMKAKIRPKGRKNSKAVA